MSDKNGNISILGAGPSGLSAAITLAQNGRTATVYEHREYPGAKYKNGWQILENYSSDIDALTDLQLMGIQPDFYYHPQYAVDFYDSRLREFSLSSKKPFGYLVKRGGDTDTLDTALYRTARQLGVLFNCNTRIQPMNVDIIGGGSSFVSGVSKEIVFTTSASDTCITILDNYLTPLGFSYLFIINGHGTIGAAILRDFKYIDMYAETVVLRFRQITDFDIRNIQESTSSVDFFIPKTAVENSHLYVGEAAGFQDFLFGLNIRRALQSGYLAAKSIIEGIPYDDLWKKYFDVKMKNSILNRFIYEKCGNSGYSIMLYIGKHFDFKKIGYFLNNPGFLRRSAAFLLRKMWHNNPSRSTGRCEWCNTF